MLFSLDAPVMPVNDSFTDDELIRVYENTNEGNNYVTLIYFLVPASAPRLV